MKIISYSDLHLESGHDWRMPADIGADILILAGDIIRLRDPEPLVFFLRDWKKPVLFVAGNHEYYRGSISEHSAKFREWLKIYLPQVRFLSNESISIGGVHFFGGTMWTDFDSGNEGSMLYAKHHMNDFEVIREQGRFTPARSVKLHKDFTASLERWFKSAPKGPRVIITHHAPIANPSTKYVGSPLQPAFVSSDMFPLIKHHQPDIWIYGHTHECGAHAVGKTRLISNQLGYFRPQGRYECGDRFDKYGRMVEFS